MKVNPKYVKKTGEQSYRCSVSIPYSLYQKIEKERKKNSIPFASQVNLLLAHFFNHRLRKAELKLERAAKRKEENK